MGQLAWDTTSHRWGKRSPGSVDLVRDQLMRVPAMMKKTIAVFNQGPGRTSLLYKNYTKPHRALMESGRKFHQAGVKDK